MDPATPGGSSFAAIGRLGPYLRPHRRPLILSVLCTMTAMAAGLLIPLMIQAILDGPVARRDTGALWWPTCVGTT